MAQRDFGPTSDLGPIGQSVHTETYNPAPNNNQGDMGIIHSYRFVNTEGMYGMLSGSKAYTVDVGDFPLDFYLDFCPRQEDSEGHTNYFYNNVNIHFTNINAGATVHTLNFTPRPNNEFCDMGASHSYRNVNTLYMYKVNMLYPDDAIKLFDVGSHLPSEEEDTILFEIYNQFKSGSHLEYSNGYIPSTFKMELTNVPTYHTSFAALTYPNQNIDLLSIKAYRYINTVGLYRYYTTSTDPYDNASIDVGYWSGQSTNYSARVYTYDGNIYGYKYINLTNVPSGPTTHTLTKTLDSYIYGNNAAIDLTASHSYRFVNTQGFYYKYTGAAYKPTIDVGALTSATATGAYTSNISTLQTGGNNFYNNINVYLSNVPTKTLHSTTKTLSSYSYGNNSQISLGDYHNNKYIDTSGYLYYKYTATAYRPTIDVGAITSGSYPDGYTGNISTLQTGGNNFYNNINVYLNNVPIAASVTVTSAETSDVASGKTFYKVSSSGSLSRATGIMATRTASSETIASPKTYYPGYYPSEWTVTPKADSVPQTILDTQAFPLLITRGRTTASGWNNMLVLPNYKIANAGYVGATTIGFPGTPYAKSGNQMSYGPFNISETNAVFNFLKDSSCGLTASNAFFTVNIINSTSGLYALNIRYNGWYKLEISFSSANVVAPANNVCNLYVYSNASIIPANGNYDVASTSKGTLLIVYGNNVSYGVNNSPSTSSTVYSAQGYGFTYRYLYKDACLVGRISGADSVTRVSEFRIGLVYNSALKILR